MNVEKVSAAYGISCRTLHHWKKRGLTLADFRDPGLVAQRLAETARNRSPKIEALFSKPNQLHILFRMSVSNAIQSEK
jgi:hypothetical protein